MEAHLTPCDTRKGIGISGCRKNLTRGGDAWTAPDEPFWGPEAAFRRASLAVPAGADLCGMAWPTSAELDQLRRQGSLQRSMQRTTDPEDESPRHARGVASLGRGLLLGTNGEYADQWAII